MPNAFGRALGKTPRSARRSETVYEESGVEYTADGGVGGGSSGGGGGGGVAAVAMAAQRNAHSGGVHDIIQVLRERQDFLRQLTVDTIRLCQPLCELEPSIEALIRLQAIEREAVAREVEAREAVTRRATGVVDEDDDPSKGAFIEKLHRVNSSTSASPNVAVGINSANRRVELSLDDVEAELVNVQRLIE
jgi:hypothetical protein